MALGISNLKNSGEYAVPLLLQTLLDASQERLWTRVVIALPKIGKPAVNPLVQALEVDDENVRQNLIHALGEIGYPQAVPYLRKLINDQKAPADSKAAAEAAIARIESLVGRPVRGTAAELFFRLAESYFHEDEAVRADPRLAEANVWQWDEGDQTLVRVPVPQKIFGPVMAMRTAELALQQQEDHQQAISLWLAANIRREGRLAMNVESSDPTEQGEPDPTLADNTPRALYYAQAAGPRYAHLVLARAIADQDSDVALGAIEALRVTAGQASLIGSEDYKQPLAQSLRFPDLLVRIRAALALGAALPRSAFLGSEMVVPTLAATLALNGRDQILVVDPDEGNLNRVAADLRAGDRDVVAATSFMNGLQRARSEFQQISAVYLASDVSEPTAAGALEALRSEFLYEKTPVVVMYKRRQNVMAEQLAGQVPLVTTVPASAAEADLTGALQRARAESGRAEIAPEMALSLALQAAETLRLIAVDGRTVYDIQPATAALIAALTSKDEKLQTTCASVLALIDSSEPQRAIAHLALNESNTPTLRVAAFGSVAESAKRFGNMLEPGQIDKLIQIAKDEKDLVIRTAASQALGALNLVNDKASEIIRKTMAGQQVKPPAPPSN
jgi:HEAT repeat protein